MWAIEQVEPDKYVYSFEGRRNLIICALSRYHAFVEASNVLLATRDYDVYAYEWVKHGTVYVVDNEGYITEHEIYEEV